MPAPLRLRDAFENGEIADYRLEDLVRKGPPAGKNWLLLDACVYHVTGNNTYVRRYIGKANTDYNYMTWIAAAEVSSRYPLFNTSSAAGQGQFPPIFIVRDGEQLVVQNIGGGTHLLIRVLEW